MIGCSIEATCACSTSDLLLSRTVGSESPGSFKATSDGRVLSQSADPASTAGWRYSYRYVFLQVLADDVGSYPRTRRRAHSASFLAVLYLQHCHYFHRRSRSRNASNRPSRNLWCAYGAHSRKVGVLRCRVATFERLANPTSLAALFHGGWESRRGRVS